MCFTEDGRLARSAADAVTACDAVVAELETLVSEPSRARFLDLEDFLESLNGIEALAHLIELLRQMLLAAGHVYTSLGDATAGYYDFQSFEDALDLWRFARGDAARNLEHMLRALMAKTPSITALHTETPRANISSDATNDLESDATALVAPTYDPSPEDTHWIEACSATGQAIMRWIFEIETASVNFAILVGSVWPGPTLYGFEDEENAPLSACILLAALCGDELERDPLLFGTDEVTVLPGCIIEIPERFLNDDEECELYIARDALDPDILECYTDEARLALLAELIEAEQSLKGHAWDAGGGDPETLGREFEEEFERLAYAHWNPLSSRKLLFGNIDNPLELRAGEQLVILGVGDHFAITRADHLATCEIDLESEFFTAES